MNKQRQEITIEVHDVQFLIDNSLKFAQSFSYFNFFNNNDISYLYGAFPNIIFIGYHKLVKIGTKDLFENFQKIFNNEPEWYIGYFGYDLKNYIEKLSSNNTDIKEFPEFCLYQPKHILHFEGSKLTIKSFEDPYKLYEKIKNFSAPDRQRGDFTSKIKWQASMSVNEYIEKVNAIKEHIINGDIYEMNFCMEFFSKEVHIDPLSVYTKLNSLSPMPFSIFGKYGHHYIMCASPERFLKKQDQKLISQPIKGTSRRGKNEKEDSELKDQLYNDEKERAENLMIVDLVRNDLAKSSVAGSVKVEELFKIYSFQQVHQMISTVVAEIKPEVNITDAIKNAFPMGSMTGAPKIKVMELIEHYENTKRGIYSGASGFITPSGDFDFNVIIRCLFYNDESKTLSFQVGSAITYDSIPEKEYEECLLKAEAMMDSF